MQPDPVRFVQLTTKYWEEFGPNPKGWMNIGYHPPDGCGVSNVTSVCPEGSLDLSLGVAYCQYCNTTSNPDAAPYTYVEWLFTSKPHVFGLMPGWANPTGIALILILTIMVIGSLPMVRRGGYFEIFYFSHLLYWVYFSLMILHAPSCWKWLLVPVAIFVLEVSYRLISLCVGNMGKTANTMLSKESFIAITSPFRTIRDQGRDCPALKGDLLGHQEAKQFQAFAGRLGLHQDPCHRHV